MSIRIQLLLLVLLAEPLAGFGQQQPASSLESLVAAAQQAQAARDYAAAANDYKQAARMEPNMPQLWANLGLMQQDAGDTPAALESFERAHHLNPSLYVPNLFLGIDYTKMGKAKEAVPFLLKAEKGNPADPQVFLALGRAYLSLGSFGPAARELGRAVQLDPKLGSGWFALGIADLDDVETEARAMTDENSSSPYSQALYAESLEQQGRYKEAAEIFRKIMDASPPVPCMGSELGYSLLRHHDASAASVFSAERAAHPECALAVIGQARIAIGAGANDEALRLLEELWKTDHGYVLSHAALVSDDLDGDSAAAWASFLAGRRAAVPDELYSALAASFGGAAQMPGAIPAAEDAAAASTGVRRTAREYYAARQFRLCAGERGQRLAGQPAGQLQLIASCAFFTGDYERASAAASALQAEQPHSTAAQYWSIKANERLAFQALDRFQQLEPNSARSYILLGDIYRQRKRYDDAAMEYQKALDIAPDNLAALLGLAAAYLDNDEIDKTIRTAQAALDRAPADPELNLIMAEALVNRHDFAAAKPYLEKSLHAKPQMLPYVHALFGKVYAEMGNVPEAIAELKLGESSDEDGTIHYQLARLYGQIGDNKSAAEALERMKALKQTHWKQKLITVDDPDLTAPAAGP